MPVSKPVVDGRADVADGWGAWEQLRTGGLSIDATRRVLRRTLTALLRVQGEAP